MKSKQIENKLIFTIVIALFAVFLFYPFVALLAKSFFVNEQFSLSNYTAIFATDNFKEAMWNSCSVSITAAIVSVSCAFVLAYCVNYTNLQRLWKKVIVGVATLPMLLPTITYGFAIIYSFGKQGLITKLFGFQFFNVYGFQGVLLGYVIYTLPVAFLLINNAMKQIDKRYITVSKLMKDQPVRTFYMTLLRPLVGTFAVACIQCFFLSFTDFGIPASVGGKFQVIASLLYSFMLGSIPDFARGAVIAMVMLIPSILSIVLMQYLERFNIRYKQVNEIKIARHPLRDICFGGCSLCIILGTLSIFAVIFIIPFVEQWPYQITFTWEHFASVFADETLFQVCKNSLLVATLTSLLGTLLSYGAAIVSQRSLLKSRYRHLMDRIALITNTIPGMVIGISYLFIFSGTSLQNTFVIMIICNLVHFFATPFLMMKETLSKMNPSFETTAKLMGDSWFQTMKRIITPNAYASLVEVFAYYFVNSMVTISAIIFIAGAKTMVITTKIKELQYFAKFNEIFVLSLLILFVNVLVKYICNLLIQRERGKRYEKI